MFAEYDAGYIIRAIFDLKKIMELHLTFIKDRVRDLSLEDVFTKTVTVDILWIFGGYNKADISSERQIQTLNTIKQMT